MKKALTHLFDKKKAVFRVDRGGILRGRIQTLRDLHAFGHCRDGGLGCGISRFVVTWLHSPSSCAFFAIPWRAGAPLTPIVTVLDFHWIGYNFKKPPVSTSCSLRFRLFRFLSFFSAFCLFAVRLLLEGCISFFLLGFFLYYSVNFFVFPMALAFYFACDILRLLLRFQFASIKIQSFLASCSLFSSSLSRSKKKFRQSEKQFATGAESKSDMAFWNQKGPPTKRIAEMREMPRKQNRASPAGGTRNWANCFHLHQIRNASQVRDCVRVPQILISILIPPVFCSKSPFPLRHRLPPPPSSRWQPQIRTTRKEDGNILANPHWATEEGIDTNSAESIWPFSLLVPSEEFLPPLLRWPTRS